MFKTFSPLLSSLLIKDFNSLFLLLISTVSSNMSLSVKIGSISSVISLFGELLVFLCGDLLLFLFILIIVGSVIFSKFSDKSEFIIFTIKNIFK